MSHLLRHPGAETLLGLLAGAIGIFAIGLGIAAIDDQEAKDWKVIACFIGSGVFFVLFLVGWIVLALDSRRRSLLITELAALMRQGNRLLDRVKDDKECPDAEIEAWEQSILKWLHSKLPDYESDFAIDRADQSKRHAGLTNSGSYLANFLDGRLLSLLDIRREFRAER